VRKAQHALHSRSGAGVPAKDLSMILEIFQIVKIVA
jgi:hypothetical protein